MGKRWNAAGGRRPVLDLGGVSLAASSAVPPTPEEEAPPPPPPPVEVAPAPQPAAALLGLDVYGDEEDDDEEEPKHEISRVWHRILDAGTNVHYYWNVQTNEVRWEWPEGADIVEGAPVDVAAAAEPASAAVREVLMSFVKTIIML